MSRYYELLDSILTRTISIEKHLEKLDSSPAKCITLTNYDTIQFISIWQSFTKLCDILNVLTIKMKKNFRDKLTYPLKMCCLFHDPRESS